MKEDTRGSNSSYLVCTGNRIAPVTESDMKKYIDWAGFYTHIVFAIKNGNLQEMTAKDWTKLNGDSLVKLMVKLNNIMKSYTEAQDLDTAMSVIFDDKIVKKPIIPRFEAYRANAHNHTENEGIEKTTYVQNPIKYREEEESAFKLFSEAFNHYLDGMAVHTLYTKLCTYENPLEHMMLFSLGRNSDALLFAEKKNLLTDYELKLARDIKSMDLLPVIFPSCEIASYEYY